ncbi:50S ribosomal protein L29 [Candidatus Woesearchaeota archaeon]|nr:50S ribosomal protein L29 [Candidatus Woesearchaeota archaeon]
MKITKDLQKLSSTDLRSRLAESKKELLKMNAQASTGNVSNPGKIQQTKKNIARVLTLLNQREDKDN